MNKTISISDVLKLSVSERIQLVEDVWDSIANIPSSITLTSQQKETLDLRLNSYHKNPDVGSPWDLVKEKLLKKK
jgi:putative addiction module component (TIGR02574 family)